MGLNLEQTRRALGIGASQAAGLRENFGTMTKPFHPGRSAESGIVAAEFAKMGWTATPVVLEANRGFFKAAGGGYDAAAIEGKLGNSLDGTVPTEIGLMTRVTDGGVGAAIVDGGYESFLSSNRVSGGLPSQIGQITGKMLLT